MKKEDKGSVRYGMVIDLRRCIGCHSCSVACKNENDVPLGVWRSWVKQIERGVYPRVRKFFLPFYSAIIVNVPSVSRSAR